MTNRARGERSIEVPGVGQVKLCMTMASMAAIEDGFGVDRLQDAMKEIGSNPGSKQIATIISALTIGDDGEPLHSVEQVRKWPLPISEISVAMEALSAGSESAEEAGEATPGNRKARRATKPK